MGQGCYIVLYPPQTKMCEVSHLLSYHHFPRICVHALNNTHTKITGHSSIISYLIVTLAVTSNQLSRLGIMIMVRRSHFLVRVIVQALGSSSTEIQNKRKSMEITISCFLDSTTRTFKIEIFFKSFKAVSVYFTNRILLPDFYTN